MTITVYLRSLGCAKNLVDSEMMSGLLAAHDFRLVDQPAAAEVIIVNTCAFIRAAKEEAIDNILELAQYKGDRCRLLVVVGCLIEKYRQEVLESLPEIDAVLGTQDYQQIVKLVSTQLGLEVPSLAGGDPYLSRRLSTPPYTAYLKIADGCDNRCSYCLIPQLRGPYRSRPLSEVVTEARALAERGVKELVVIAQDSTNYGHDLYGKPRLAQLLEELAQLPLTWIRLLYVYPDLIDEELLAVMARHDNICHYLDLPLQHANDQILQAMNRRGSVQEIRDKIALIRRYLPDVALRTTMMVGFPGETREAFADLLAFLKEMRFQWVGVFKYCREADTPAYDLPQQVSELTKLRREDKAMTLQARLTEESLQHFCGQELEVLVEHDLGDLWQGRSRYHAPEVDGVIFFTGDNLKPGDLVRVRITGCATYDLQGVMV